MNIDIKFIEDMDVVFVECENFPNDIGKTWYNLECRFNSLRGRKFYGVFFVEDNKPVYRACSKIKDDDDLNKLGFKTFTIPGGVYAGTKVKDWQDKTNSFEEIFRKISEEYPFDSSRPSLEYYRSEKETILMLPVLME